MRESTAEIWIGPDQSADFMGTGGGLNPTWLLILRENSRPAWLLVPGNLYDSTPPVIGTPKVWIPSPDRPIEDALVMFAICGLEDTEVLSVLREYVVNQGLDSFDVGEVFPEGMPEAIYEIARRRLDGLHLVASVGEYSLASNNLEALDHYDGMTVEIRTTSLRKAAVSGQS